MPGAPLDDDLPPRADVVVVGAGLAGLAAAQRLDAAGVDVLVLERGSTPGGRVRTDVVDGLRLDRGFQVLNPAYPALPRVVDLDALALRPFLPGVVVAAGDRRWTLTDPRRAPGGLLDDLRAPIGGLAGRVRLAAYAVPTAYGRIDRVLDRPDTTAAQALADAGVPEPLVDRVLRPFLAGVFLEDELATSRRFLDLVLRSFARGTPGLPERGMQALPEAMAQRLRPGRLRCGTHVAGVGPTSGGVEVRTDRGPATARAVVVATDAPTATRLLPGLDAPPGNAVTTWYHLADVPAAALAGGSPPALVVDGERRGPVVNSAVLTAAAPTYASDDRVLVSSSVLGVHDDRDAEEAVRRHLSVLHGVDASGWTGVARYAIPYAVPAAPPPLDVRRPVHLRDGVFVCGDHRDTPSTQGALASGRRAAGAVLRELGVPVAA